MDPNNNDFIIEKMGFTTVFNDIVRLEIEGKRLTPEAIGLYLIMMSLPDDWDYTIMGLTKIVNAGKNKISRMLKELENYGFLIRRQTFKNGKFWKMSYTILSKPRTTFPQNQLACNDTQEKKQVEKTYKHNDKGENPPSFTNHYLTNVLIDKKLIDILDYDLENYNEMFKDLDNRYDYKLVLHATRYLVDYQLRKNDKQHSFRYFKSAMENNLEKLTYQKKYEFDNPMVKEFFKNVNDNSNKSNNLTNDILDKLWNDTPVMN